MSRSAAGMAAGGAAGGASSGSASKDDNAGGADNAEGLADKALHDVNEMKSLGDMLPWKAEVGSRLGSCLDASDDQKGDAWREDGSIARRPRKKGLDGTAAPPGQPLLPLLPLLSLPLPRELMSHALIYADGATLTAAVTVSKALRSVVTVEHWEVAARPARWLQNPAPAAESFACKAQATSYWRRWSKLAADCSGSPSGRLVALGGSANASDDHFRGIVGRAKYFLDVRWGNTPEWKVMPRFTTPRCAAGATVDRWGRLYMLGGWDGDSAIHGCERLDHPQAAAAAMTETISHAASNRRNRDDGGSSGGSGSGSLVEFGFRSDGQGEPGGPSAKVGAGAVAGGGVSGADDAAAWQTRDQEGLVVEEDDGYLLTHASAASGSGHDDSQTAAAAGMSMAMETELETATATATAKPAAAATTTTTTTTTETETETATETETETKTETETAAATASLVSSNALARDQTALGREEPAARVGEDAGRRGPGRSRGREAWAWENLPPLQQARCFLGAAFEPRGALLAVGGGTGMYTSDAAFETVEVLRPDDDRWVAGPSMSQARCGLGVAAMPDGKVYAAGGYAGNLEYLKSAEVLDPYCDKWTTLAPMRGRRAGMALAAGPDGRLYAVGGSADGSHGHTSVERFDPREGKWGSCPPMIFGRAWCSAAFGPSGSLYVLGGMSQLSGPLRAVEMFDPRSGRWRAEDDLGGVGGIPITDACLVLQL